MQKIPLHKSDVEHVVHLLSDEEEWAIEGALAANRPLLVRGEPGIGKTQLAWAAAEYLRRPLRTLTVDAHTESREVMWTFDAVKRLAEAQVISNIYRKPDDPDDPDAIGKVRSAIDVKNFVRPGPLWWAFDWGSARRLLEDRKEPVPKPPDNWEDTKGVVVLIDEIDKGESDLPNGLLEAFGMSQFTPQGWDEPITLKQGPPLVIITSNEETALPDAFVRRCFVMNLELPDVRKPEQRPAFKEYLIERGANHFPEAQQELPQLLQEAAELLLKDRLHALQNRLTPLPGQAEYLDLLRAVMTLRKRGKDPHEVLNRLQKFAFGKARGVPS